MLRITRNDVPASFTTLGLEGRLVDPWATLLERECAHLLDDGRAVAIDLSGVALVDRRGVEALGRLHRAGVALRGCSDLLASILAEEDIVLDRSAAGTESGG